MKYEGIHCGILNWLQTKGYKVNVWISTMTTGVPSCWHERTLKHIEVHYTLLEIAYKVSISFMNADYHLSLLV